MGTEDVSRLYLTRKELPDGPNPSTTVHSLPFRLSETQTLPRTVLPTTRLPPSPTLLCLRYDGGVGSQFVYSSLYLLSRTGYTCNSKGRS